ncbi:MAG TPA: pilus assembly protein TadG-related protein [Armatimonadota bacterium]|nr:pilus assembly protein TadG-related protein [Armatimonadota bacterium]
MRKAVQNECGAVLVLSVILMVVLLGMAALAIDVGQLYLARQRAQNVCDAAALAGGRHLTGDESCTWANGKPTKAATDCRSANNTEVPSWQVNGFTVEFPTTVTFDNGTTATCDLGDAIKVTGYVHVDYAFARIFGLVSKDVHASATALLGPAQTMYFVDPLGVTPAIEGCSQGQPYDVGPVEQWQDSMANDPGNWLMLRLGNDSGMADYVDRLRMQSDPTPISVGDTISTQPGGSGGSGTGQSSTYKALVGEFHPDGSVKEPGRILLEPDTRFQASHLDADGDGYDEYYRTAYNPTAWSTWESTVNAYGLHPGSNRILILPIIDPEGLAGQSETQVLGFAAFFVERVWDGVSGEIDPASGSPIHGIGQIQGRFIQAITSGSASVGWVFEGTELVGKDSVRDLYLIS